jgi:hypothetical protein
MLLSALLSWLATHILGARKNHRSFHSIVRVCARILPEPGTSKGVWRKFGENIATPVVDMKKAPGNNGWGTILAEVSKRPKSM